MESTHNTNHIPALTDASIYDFWVLMKPRVMSLVIFTSFAGYYVAPMKIHPFLAMVGIICITLGAGAAGCLNMWIERKSDALMKRTQSRPTVTGIISSDTVLSFGLILSFFSVFLMQVAVNNTAALLLALCIGFYVGIYTIVLKPNTIQNIVIGGAAGALPPVIGWALSSSIMDWRPWILFAIIFFWTPAHFWALSLNLMADYEQAKIPVYPNVMGVERTKVMILIYALITVALAYIPFHLNMASIFYLICSLGFGLGFIIVCMQLRKSDEMRDGLKVFTYSILYLFIVFSALMIDKKEYFT